MSLENKVALVTGAAAGLGRSVALHYAQAGAKVVISDINDQGGEETVRFITNAGGTAAYTHSDSRLLEDNQALVKFAVDTYGKLDIACNNAGIAAPATPLGEVSEALWRKVLSVNLDGVFFGIKTQVAQMLEQGGGTIINMASILSQVGYVGFGPVVASKHAVAGLTKQIAVDYADKGIRAIAIGPAFMKTRLNDILTERQRSELANVHPIGRMGEADEVGAVVATVSEDSWSFVNGAYIPVDGGYLSR